MRKIPCLIILATVLLQNMFVHALADDGKQALALAKLAWMTGTWSGTNEQGVETEEHWMEPKGGVMLGMNRSVFSSSKHSYEFMRIAETAEGLVFFASPSGRPATPFSVEELTDNKVVFANAAHDFPQRIIYQRADDVMTASIEGTTNGKERSMSWKWKLQGKAKK